jgi:hypothetical protein
LKDSSNLIYKVLLTPAGISSITTQTLNVPIAWSNATQAIFSPDGRKFAYTYGMGGPNPYHNVRLFDFDRCTGNFSDTIYIEFYDGSTGFGLAFSSDSKYLYHTSFQKVYQIDSLGNADTVAINDGYYSPYPPFQTDFWWMYLAANGKIYISSGNSVIDMHYINYPDSVGMACDVQQHALHLPCYYVRGNVNHPNYYLGCDTTLGCPCLTTSVNKLTQHDFHFSVSPNPNDGNFKIVYLLLQNQSGTFEMFDVSGRKVYSQVLPKWSTMQIFSLPNLSNGIYSCVISSESARANKKIAVMKN